MKENNSWNWLRMRMLCLKKKKKKKKKMKNKKAIYFTGRALYSENFRSK